MLGDVDRQQSARDWLALRPAEPAARSAPGTSQPDDLVRPPKGTTHVVLDTPAGLHGKRLDAVMKLADSVLVPLQPSIFDICATHAFVRELLAHRRSDKVRLGAGRDARARRHHRGRAIAQLPCHAGRAGARPTCATRRTTCTSPRAA